MFKRILTFSTKHSNNGDYLEFPSNKPQFAQSTNKSIPKHNKTNNSRNLLSTDELLSFIFENQLAYLIIIILCIFVIILCFLILKYLYKQWKIMKAEQEERENSDLSDKAKTEFEDKFLNSKTFSFIPISSPIKLKGSKSPKSEESETETKKVENNECSKSVIGSPGDLKISPHSSFCISSSKEEIAVSKI